MTLNRRTSSTSVATIPPAGRAWLIAATAVLAPLVLCAALVPVRESFATTAAALVLVALIAAIAILGNRCAGVVASASSAIWFDFFLTRPYERLAISHRDDLETTVSLFVVGIIVTELAARARHHREVAARETDYVALLHEFADMLAQGVLAADVTERASSELVDLLHLRSCRYVPGAPGPHRATVTPNGDVLNGGLRWGVATMGLPGPEVDLLVQSGGRAVGRFVMVPTPGWLVPDERMIVAVSIAAYAGAAQATRARIA
jgi:K+-sensing histidine kinase KdpD